MQEIDFLYILIANRIGREYKEDKKLFIEEDDAVSTPTNIIYVDFGNYATDTKP